MAFVSLSIDLVGSTLAKQSLVTAAGHDPHKRSRFYREYLKLLFSIEREFYINLNNSFVNSGLSMDRVSLIKSIGDEYWFAIQVDPDDTEDVAAAAWSAVESSIASLSADRYLGIAPEDLEEWDDENSAVLKTNFPVKVLADIIYDPIEITGLRYQYLKDVFSILRQDSSTVFRVDAAFLDLCNRLNIGGPAVKSSSKSLVARYDYIGLEIDRFFRLTKQVHPSILAIGDNLAAHLKWLIRPLHDEFSSIGVHQIAIEPPAHMKQTTEPVDALYIHEGIPAETMKGIGESYALHHIFLPDAFEATGLALAQSSLALLASSFSFLAENGYFLLSSDNSL